LQLFKSYNKTTRLNVKKNQTYYLFFNLKWSCRQAFLVIKICVFRIIGPCISNNYGILNFIAFYYYIFSIDLGSCPIEIFPIARNTTLLQRFAIPGNATIPNLLKFYNNLVLQKACVQRYRP